MQDTLHESSTGQNLPSRAKVYCVLHDFEIRTIVSEVQLSMTQRLSWKGALPIWLQGRVWPVYQTVCCKRQIEGVVAGRCCGLVVKFEYRNKGVVSSNSARVAIKTSLVRKTMKNHLIKFTFPRKNSEPCLRFLPSSFWSMRSWKDGHFDCKSPVKCRRGDDSKWSR